MSIPEVKIDRMRYQLNKSSYSLGLLSVLTYCIYLAATMDAIPKDIFMGLEIIINLAVLMILFLGIDRARAYSVRWSYVLVLLGISILLRILWQPLVIWSNDIHDRAIASGVSLAVSGGLLIVSGIIGVRKGTALTKYNETHSEPTASLDNSSKRR